MIAACIQQTTTRPECDPRRVENERWLACLLKESAQNAPSAFPAQALSFQGPAWDSHWSTVAVRIATAERRSA
jgi:hypothetical protein